MKTHKTTPLDELIALEKDARAFGFDWPDQHMIIDQALSECAEIRAAIEQNESPTRIQEEVGDLIHTAFSFCIFAGYDIDETLSQVNHKFSQRMHALKSLTFKNGLTNLQGQTIDYMIKLWREAKTIAYEKSAAETPWQIRKMQEDDYRALAKAAKIHLSKPQSTFDSYFQEQNQGQRVVWVAYEKEHVAGYITLKWQSHYHYFQKNNIPEIMDLNVMPSFRKRGLGATLLTFAENEAATQSAIVGIGVGLYPDYGSAQRLYIKRGYIPDGQGITYHYQTLLPDSHVHLDDDLILWFTKKLK